MNYKQKKWCKELSFSFKCTVWEPCLNNCTSNTYDLLSGSKCGSPWQLLSMVHCPRSSHGDKVLNRPTVLAMWGVTLIDVPQWISLNLLCRKLSATLSLHGRALSFQHHGRLDLKDIKQICRFRERRALFDLVCRWLPQPISFGWEVHVRSFFSRRRQAVSVQTWVWVLSMIVSLQFSVTRNPLKNYHLSK